MNNESNTLPDEMLELVEVIVMQSFHFGGRQVVIGDRLTLPRHRAEYARFWGLIEWP